MSKPLTHAERAAGFTREPVERKPQATVKGAVISGQSDGAWHATVTFKCPHCDTRHRIRCRANGSMPTSFLVECKDGQGLVDVVPYR